MENNISNEIMAFGSNIDVSVGEMMSSAGILAIVLTIGLIYFFKNPIFALLSSFMGYRAGIDDFSVAVHQNRDIIFKNEQEIYKIDKTTLISGAILLLSILLLLVHPIAAAAVFLVFIGYHTSKKATKMQPYPIYRDIGEADKVIFALNNYRDHINMIANSFLITSFSLIVVGLLFKMPLIAIAGAAVGIALMTISLFAIYDIYAYRINYKPIEYYRALRLLNTTTLGNGRGFLIYLVLSGVSYYYLPGFSAYLWIVALLKGITTITVKFALRREDSVEREHQKIENRQYIKVEEISSFPNPISQSRGYAFATPLEMKFFQLEKENADEENLIHIDNYAFYPEAINRSALRKNPLITNKIKESVKIKFEVLDFTKQLVVLGGMGSGKTEMINYMIKQVHDSRFSKFKSIIFNDIKGDFTRKFYRPERDYIVNLFDARAAVWDIFAEMKHNIEAGTNFISNLFESIAGQEKDFFNARAKQLMSQWTQEAYFETENSTDAWKVLFEKIAKYEEEVGDDKTRSSIYQTIEIAVEILSIMKYQIVEEGRKTFSISEFLNDTDRQLFLVNNPQYAEKLMPYLTGIWGAVTSSVMEKPDNKNHLILNVIDEFLSLNLSESTRTTLLTAVRSKGMANILAMQYLKKDEKIIQQLDSSRYALITFNINDEFTLKTISDKFGKAEMLTSQFTLSDREGRSDVHVGERELMLTGLFMPILPFGGKLFSKKSSESMLSSLSDKIVIDQQQLQSMPKYHHLTFIPSEEVKEVDDVKRYFKLFVFDYDKLMFQVAENDDFLRKKSGIIYLGYTPMAEIEDKNSSFEKWDTGDFHREAGAAAELKKADMDGFERFKHYMNIKFAGSVEAAAEYIYENGLDEFDVEILFREVEENPQKVAEVIATKGEEERYWLMQEFFAIDKNDYKEQYEFCKKHNLLGAILGAFVFSETFNKTLLSEMMGGDGQ